MADSKEILTFGLDVINYDNDIPFLITLPTGSGLKNIEELSFFHTVGDLESISDPGISGCY